ncbi:MAG: sarcosine oxidase subunit gamma [Ahrensia sp.]|nr:sarcosine oxidase subunit gamma [Ahrensia sp.]|tara:strand:+ start:20386 stop:21012 length:627 start_codon:yes stop_codon:yes gene_type:complete
MAEPKSFIADHVLAKHAASPLAGHVDSGEFGALRDEGPGVILSERFGLSIAEVAAWKGGESKCRAAIKAAAGLTLKTAPGSGTAKPAVGAINIAPARWLVSGEDTELVAKLADEVGDYGSVVDLSHGRSVIRIDGPKSRWVLAKLFAIDFSEEAFAKGDGLSTVHHDFMVQIQRTEDDAFDIYVFRSFARSFWHLLCRSSEEVGYRVL